MRYFKNSLNRRKFIQQLACSALMLPILRSRARAAAIEQLGLKEVFKNDFYMGTAINSATFADNNQPLLNLIAREFNSITMANAFKWESIHPKVQQWDWQIPDQFIKYGTQHGMYRVGHVLVWHSQVPDTVFTDTNNQPLTKNKLVKKMENHIHTVVSRFRGKIQAWDVVNEAIDEDKGWRNSLWYKIIGEKYMEYAFQFAHQADSQCHLIYNDYNMHLPGKRKFLVDVINKYKKSKIPIHGIGMQGHVGLNFPDLDQFEQSIIAYADLGLRVHITELDVDVLPVAWSHMGAEISTLYELKDELNPYVKGLPLEKEQQLTRRYTELFKLFLKHRDKIERVTFWGTSDDESWKNDFPVRGRTNYPLLFDRNQQPKPAYFAVRELKQTPGNK